MDLTSSSSTNTPKSTKKLPFTSSERELIVALVRERPIIEDKRTNAKNIEFKKQAWDELAIAFNAQPYVFPRSSIQLKRCWENIKTLRKKELSQESSYMTGTGGGPSQGGSSASLDNIVDIICPFINLKVPGVIDSNSIEISHDLKNYSTTEKLNDTTIAQSGKIDSNLIDIKENKKRKQNFDAQEVLTDITNYTKEENENFDQNLPSQPKRKQFNASGTNSVGKNKISSEIQAWLRRCNINIQQDQDLHELRTEREKMLTEKERIQIEKEKSTLKFEKEMHTLQLEKLRLEIDMLKKQL